MTLQKVLGKVLHSSITLMPKGKVELEFQLHFNFDEALSHVFMLQENL